MLVCSCVFLLFSHVLSHVYYATCNRCFSHITFRNGLTAKLMRCHVACPDKITAIIECLVYVFDGAQVCILSHWHVLRTYREFSYAKCVHVVISPML